jgi:hypothetical protein
MIDVAWLDVTRALPQFKGMKIHDYHLQRNDIALCSRRKGYTTSLKKFRELGTLDRIAFAGDYLINSKVGQSLHSGKQAAQQLLSVMNDEISTPVSVVAQT